MLKATLASVFILTAVPLLGLAHETPNVISMTAEGFEPKEVEIHAGGTIVFQNNDTRDRWPASNFHPTHSLYPEFDPQRPTKPGTSWSFKFEKEGVWRMHDHLFPHMTGTITVLAEQNSNGPVLAKSSKLKAFFADIWEGIADFFKKFAEAFRKTGKRTSLNPAEVQAFSQLPEREQYKFLEDVSKERYPETAWAYVKEAYNKPTGVVGNPHDLAHLVGQLIFDKYEFSGLPICDPIFAFGCYHGVMEKAFEKTGLEKVAEAEKGCEQVANADNMSVRSCIHGIGHGFATYEEHDLPKALGDCEKLKQTYQINCFDGVFMEFMISAPPSFYKTANPLYPCTDIDKKYRTACGRSVPQVMRIRMNMDTPAIAKNCLATDDRDITYHCIDAAGYYIGQQSQGRADYILSNCSATQNAAAEAQCNAAAAGEIIFQNYAGWQAAAPEVCSKQPAEEFKNECFKRVESVKTLYHRN